MPRIDAAFWRCLWLSSWPVLLGIGGCSGRGYPIFEGTTAGPIVEPMHDPTRSPAAEDRAKRVIIRSNGALHPLSGGSADAFDRIPLLYTFEDIPAASEFWDDALGVQADGGDLLVTADPQTAIERLPAEIVFLDKSNRRGEIYFRGTLQDGQDTTFHLYYQGNATGGLAQPSPDAPFGRNEVWSDYLAVFHLQDSEYVDATGRGHTGSVGLGAPSIAEARLGSGVDLDQNGGAPDPDDEEGIDIEEIGTDFDLASQVTLEAWVLARSDTRPFAVIAGHGEQYQLRLTFNQDNTAEWVVREQAGYYVAGSMGAIVSPSAPEWHHLVGTFEATLTAGQLKLHMDGQLGSAVDTSGELLWAQPQNAPSIGWHGRFSPERSVDAVVDEVRFAGSVAKLQQGDYIRVQHAMQRSNVDAEPEDEDSSVFWNAGALSPQP